MIKELLLAVTLGTLLGFGVTGGIVAIQKNRSSVTPETTISPTPTITDTHTNDTASNSDNTNVSTNSHQITIESPNNESVVDNSQVTLKGSTTPQSHLIITTPSKTYFAFADNAGNFSTDIEIDSGVNIIQIDSVDSQDNQADVQLIITYSTAKF